MTQNDNLTFVTFQPPDTARDSANAFLDVYLRATLPRLYEHRKNDPYSLVEKVVETKIELSLFCYYEAIEDDFQKVFSIYFYLYIFDI